MWYIFDASTQTLIGNDATCIINDKSITIELNSEAIVSPNDGIVIEADTFKYYNNEYPNEFKFETNSISWFSSNVRHASIINSPIINVNGYQSELSVCDDAIELNVAVINTGSRSVE